MSLIPHGGPPAGSGTRSESSRVPAGRIFSPKFGKARGAGVPTSTIALAANAAPVPPTTIAAATIRGRANRRPRSRANGLCVRRSAASRSWRSNSGMMLTLAPPVDALASDSPRLTRFRITSSDVSTRPRSRCTCAPRGSVPVPPRVAPLGARRGAPDSGRPGSRGPRSAPGPRR